VKSTDFNQKMYRVME